MPTIKIDVDGVDKTFKRIKRDLHRGMEKSVDTLIDNAKDHARRTIHEERAIFNAEVYSGFKTAETKNTPTTVRKKLYNDVDHADALEHGAEYPSRGPPIEALLPWVARKMNGNWSLDDSFGGGGDGISNGRGDGGNLVREEEDEEVVDQETIEEDDTDEGLTLSKQADDISVNSGNIDSLFERGARETLFKVEEWQRDYDLPRVDSLRSGTYETVEDAFLDDSNTINIPGNLLEFDTEFTGANFEDLFDEDYYNVRYDQHLTYVIDHQYGAYIYDNLNDTGLNEFRTRWGFTETDSGWELPGDADEISGLATTNERRFFAEVFVKARRDGYNYKQREKEDFFDNIYDIDSGYYNTDFVDKPRDTVDYKLGYDYSGDREVVLEEHIGDYSTRKTDQFTTDFNNYHYTEEGPGGQGFKDRSEYIFTSPTFEGAKVLEYVNGEFAKNGIVRDRDELTLQGIPETERRFNNIKRGDQVLIENQDEFYEGGDYISVEITNHQNNVWQQNVSEGEDVFTGNTIEIHPNNIIATRKEQPDLWADGYETVDTVTPDEIESGFTGEISDSDIDYDTINRTINEIGHFILKDDDSGDKYKARRNDERSSEYISLHPNEDGEYLEWDTEDITITNLSERAVQYNSIEDGDNVLIDPDGLDEDSNFTDSVYRATVNYVDRGGPIVVPFGTSTNDADRVTYDSFIDRRENLPGWDSKNWEKGVQITIEDNLGRIKTGRLETPESTFGDNKAYEADRMKMITEDGDDVRFRTQDIVSFQKDDFMERGEDHGNLDLSITEYSQYDGEISTDELSSHDYSPLNGVEHLEKGVDISYEIDGINLNSSINSIFTDDGQKKYLTEDGETIRPRDITSFDGMGADEDDLEEGVTISTGSSFGEITGVRDGDIKSYEIDFDGDGSYDDVLQAEKIQNVPLEIPKGSSVMFWSYREGEWKTGTVKRNGFATRIETEDGDIYSTINETYPIEIYGVDV